MPRAKKETGGRDAPTVDVWYQCYGATWQGIATEACAAHPAKFSKKLIFRIIEHTLQEGWLKAGDTTVDCFGGVGLGGLPCALQGIQWVGWELEPKFVTLGQENLALWQRRYGQLPQWVPPVLLQGDSRALAQVLGQAECCVSSPPYAEGLGHARGEAADRKEWDTKSIGSTTYGTTPGNLGNMTPGEIEAVVSSPPYADGCGQQGHDYHPERMAGARTGYLQADAHGYGTSPGNLGNMTTGDVEACVSSPPFAGMTGNNSGNPDFYQHPTQQKSYRYADTITSGVDTYGTHPGQLGNTQGDTFWAASKTIVEQVFSLLRPGGHAIWVVKAYCRNGAIVDFPGQWRALCEHVGFVTLHEHHAMQVESHSEMGLFGEPVEMYHVEYKSFFRWDNEKKRPHLKINYETVFCMVTPQVCISSPPYNLPMSQDHNGSKGGTRGTTPSESRAFVKYGNHPGQLEGLSPGSLDAVLSSPPFADTDTKPTKLGSGPGTRASGDSAGRNKGDYYYGETPGNLGQLPAGSVDLVCSSPPYVETIQNSRSGIDKTKGVDPRHPQSQSVRRLEELAEGYGDTPGQLGAMKPGTPPQEVP